MFDPGHESGPKAPRASGVHAGGRPTKLNRAMIAEISKIMRDGSYMETAAACAGVPKETLYRWLRAGAVAETGIYKEFRDAMIRATGEAERDAVEMVTKASSTDWRAAAWKLERRFPHRWGRLERIEHTGADGKDLFDAAALLAHPALAPLPPEDRRRIAGALRKILPMLAAAAGQDDEDEADGDVIEVPVGDATVPEESAGPAES